MAAGSFVVFSEHVRDVAERVVNLASDTFKCALISSAWTPAQSTDASYTTISTYEIANGNGYTTGGATLTGVTVSDQSTGTKFDCNDITFTASGGSIVARYALIYDDTTAGKRVVAYCLLDTTPANVTLTAGNTMTITIPAAGIYVASPA